MLGSNLLSETVKRLLDEILADSSPDKLGLREIVSRSHALPIWLDMGGCFCVRTNGEIISFCWDTPDDIQIEVDPRIRNIALYQGSKKYPALREFVPARPTAAVECPHCKGKGEFPEPLGQVVCYCGGVGWLPPREPGSCG